MSSVCVFLITGFEEIEALATVDVLRRAGIATTTISLTGDKTVTGAHQIPVVADQLFEQTGFSQARMLVIPGGTPKFSEHAGLAETVRTFYEKGGKIAAICASPMVLGRLGLLKGKNATCYPGFEQYLEGARLQTDKAVIVDGNITTGRGPGLTLDFALNLVEQLEGPAKRDEVARALLLLA